MTGRAEGGNADPAEGRPRSLAGLVEYQDASVVSRTLLHSEAATLTLFAFDEGQGLSEHTTPFEAMIHVVEGEAEVTLSGTAHAVQQGEILMMAANEPHAVRAVARFKMMLLMVRT